MGLSVSGIEADIFQYLMYCKCRQRTSNFKISYKNHNKCKVCFRWLSLKTTIRSLRFWDSATTSTHGQNSTFRYLNPPCSTLPRWQRSCGRSSDATWPRAHCTSSFLAGAVKSEGTGSLKRGFRKGYVDPLFGLPSKQHEAFDQMMNIFRPLFQHQKMPWGFQSMLTASNNPHVVWSFDKGFVWSTSLCGTTFASNTRFLGHSLCWVCFAQVHGNLESHVQREEHQGGRGNGQRYLLGHFSYWYWYLPAYFYVLCFVHFGCRWMSITILTLNTTPFSFCHSIYQQSFCRQIHVERVCWLCWNCILHAVWVIDKLPHVTDPSCQNVPWCIQDGINSEILALFQVP